MTNGIQYDAQGRPYVMQGARRNYISPVAYGQPLGGNPESAWHSAPQWNQYSGQAENPFKWGKALTVATGAGLGAGVLSAAGVGGAGAGAGASAPPATGGGAGVASFWSSPLAGQLIGGGIDAATGLIGAGMQSSAAVKAAALQQQYNQQALEFMKQQDARDFAEYLKERERGWQHQDEDRALERTRFDAREGRMTPYRDLGAQGARNLASLLTLPQGGVMRDPSLADLLGG
jgi:hypothetical protein